MAIVLLSGASGFLGVHLRQELIRAGHQVISLVRHSPQSEQERYWNVEKLQCDLKSGDRFDSVIHLAGESIANGYWTKTKKQRILNSRLQSSRLLVDALHKISSLPQVFLSASAVGYYGDCGALEVTESAPAGSMFLSDVCCQWERECRRIESSGVRSIQLRFGMILGTQGGALSAMLPAFRFGLGATLGSGTQFLSWVSQQDTVAAILHCLDHNTLRGPVNVVSPNPVTNREFTVSLAAELRRPALFRAPGFLLKLILGDIAEELLLSSCRARPEKLQELHYKFRHPDLAAAFSEILGSRKNA